MFNDRWTLIEAGVLIDGTGAPPQRRMAVLVMQRGRVVKHILGA